MSKVCVELEFNKEYKEKKKEYNVEIKIVTIPIN